MRKMEPRVCYERMMTGSVFLNPKALAGTRAGEGLFAYRQTPTSREHMK